MNRYFLLTVLLVTTLFAEEVVDTMAPATLGVERLSLDQGQMEATVSADDTSEVLEFADKNVVHTYNGKTLGGWVHGGLLGKTAPINSARYNAGSMHRDESYNAGGDTADKKNSSQKKSKLNN